MLATLSRANIVSIIVPVHNEEEIIESFLKQVSKSCKKLKLNYEIIVVENGSIDKSIEIIKKAADLNKRIKLQVLKKTGYGLALIRGLKSAKGKYLVIFNADFWDLRFLMLTQVDLLGYDVISGSKLLPGAQDERSFNRRLVSWGFNKFLNLILGFQGTDTHGVKILRASNVLPLVSQCKTTSGIFDSELMIRAQRKGLKILELPVKIHEIRPARFELKRTFQTPRDIWKLYRVF